jgi:hypothetical protein
MNKDMQAAVDHHTAAFGGGVPTTNLDLGLAMLIALGLPFATAWLFERTGGALLGLLLYYGVCWAVPRWRKGTWDYRWPNHWPWPLFGASLLVPLAIAAINWGGLPRQQAPTAGFLVTLGLWAPLNAATEQLSWQYVLDSWRNRWPGGRRLGLVVGIVLLLVLVGLIHVLFWSRFLPSARPTRWSWLGIPLNFVLTATYVLLYYRARSMWPVFWVHLLADLQLVLLAHYSIVPDL